MGIIRLLLARDRNPVNLLDPRLTGGDMEPGKTGGVTDLSLAFGLRTGQLSMNQGIVLVLEIK